MGLRLSKNYLATIWLLLSLGTVLHLIDTATQLREERARLEVNLQEQIEAAQVNLAERSAQWDEQLTLAKADVTDAKKAVSDFITPDTPEPNGYYFRQAQQLLNTARTQLETSAEASEEELEALQESVQEATANLPAELTRFDKEEALQFTDWLFALLGVFIGLGLLKAPVPELQTRPSSKATNPGVAHGASPTSSPEPESQAHGGWEQEDDGADLDLDRDES
jgi:hypothetical protein